MILEWLVGLAAGLFEWIANLLPDWEVPAGLTDPGGAIEQIVALSQGIGVFVDWGLLGLLAVIPLGVWLFGLIFRALKTLISHLPFVGGN